MSNSCSTTVLAADEKVRITRFDFDPGQETGWHVHEHNYVITCLLYTSPSPRDLSTSRMPSSA